jgi:type I restriction enzyme M protein
VVENDLIESVITLPENLFYNTDAPGCILIFNKNKPDNRQENIQFIYADDYYEPGTNQNTLREKDIAKISKSHQEFSSEEGFSSIVDIDAIRENDYNLMVSRYVDISTEREEYDVESAWETISKTRDRRDELFEEISSIIDEVSK